MLSEFSPCTITISFGAKEGSPNLLFSLLMLHVPEKFVWANAKIVGDKVEVWNEKINNPIVVRYAWDNNPAAANLFSKEGLPATPFEVIKK